MGGALIAGSPPRVRTDAVAWEQNPGWAAPAGSHVLSPLDAGFDEDGTCVYIPHCPTRLLSLLETRTDLDAGEAVTVAVSVLRGAAEAHGLGAENGEWWVTSDGRPLVATTGESPWRGEAVEVLRRVAESSTVLAPDILVRATTAIADPRRLKRDLPGLEEVLFRAADALALVTDAVVPRSRTASSPPHEVQADVVRRPGIVRAFLSRHVDAAWSERVDEVMTLITLPGFRRRARDGHRTAVTRPVRGRRMPRPAVLGTAAAALVLTVGLSWRDQPQDDAAAREKATATPVTSTRRPSDPAPETALPSPTPAPTGEDRTARAAEDLLDELAACVESGCGARVVEQPGRTFPQGPATTRGIDRHVEIIDDYGGVTAVRVSSGERAQIAVIVQAEHKWLVRDIYDVADQPD